MTDYPIKFVQCPCCGSTRRVVEEEVQNEIDNGKINPGTRIPAIISQSPIYNPQNMVLIASRPVKVITCYYDICLSCGCLYCVESIKQDGILDTKQKPNTPPPGVFPGQN